MAGTKEELYPGRVADVQGRRGPGIAFPVCQGGKGPEAGERWELGPIHLLGDLTDRKYF